MVVSIDKLKAVAAAIERQYDLSGLAVDYPGYISIPERLINDEVDASDNVWAVGPGDVAGSWTGQLTTPDGAQVVGELTFKVYPISDSDDDIASAIYTHGIGDLYIGGGCPDCPVRKAVQ